MLNETIEMVQGINARKEATEADRVKEQAKSRTL
jgi:hypothetical protein